MLRWATDEALEIALIDPGKPWQNGEVESFNGNFRKECLSMEWFRSRTGAKVVIEDWRRQYYEVRRHSILGKMTPQGLRGNDRQQPKPGSHLQELSGPKSAEQVNGILLLFLKLP